VLRRRISLELGWSVSVPEYRDSVDLEAVGDVQQTGTGE